MAVVYDASFAAAWCFGDERGSAAAEGIVRRFRDRSALVPSIFWYEIRNVLVLRERREEAGTGGDFAAVFLERLGELDVEEVSVRDTAAVLDLARRHRLTIYDAAYLDLAIGRGARLATLDRRMAEAAAAEGLETAGW